MMRWPLALLTALVLLLAACDDGTTSTTALEGGADAVEVGGEDAAGPEPASTATPATDAAADAGAGAADAPADTGSAAEDAATGGPADGDVIDVRTDHPVTPRPGRWAVAEAGTVEFDRTDRGLVLVDVRAAEGWDARIDEEDDDELEVDFRRANTEIEIEIELEDGDRLEVEIRADIDPADPGVYDLGQAGSVEIARDGGGLQLVDVVVADGWELRIDEESADEIEVELGNGPERWDFEAELDDGELEIQLDYEVRG